MRHIESYLPAYPEAIESKEILIENRSEVHFGLKI